MIQELLDIITRLEKDPSRLLTVINAESYTPIISSWSAQRIAEKYGSVMGFFEELVSNGTIQIVVEERRKHGTSSVAVADKKTFKLRPKNQPMETENTPSTMPAYPVQPPMITHQSTPQIPLNGLAGFGLGLPELINLNVSAHEKVRLETENKFYKEENERLKTEVAELKEERLKNQFSEAKAQGLTDILKGAIPHIGTIIGALKGVSAPAGLSAPEPQMPEFPEEKQALFEQFSQTSPEIDVFMMAVLEGVYTNESFYKDLEEILKKHNLIAV